MAERAASSKPSGREALPLTFNNVFEAVKIMTSWRELAQRLMGWDDYERYSKIREKLDAIQRQHVSNDACLKAVVEAFLLGEGHYQPSWRRLIHALHKAEQSYLAETIKTNAEPRQDPTMAVDNVSQILNKISGDEWEEVMGRNGLDIPGPLLEEIQRRYSTNIEKNHACADYYVNYHPNAEWAHLTMGLYLMHEFASARESKSFMSTDPTLTVDNVCHVMEKVEPKVKWQVWEDAYYAPLDTGKVNTMWAPGKDDECADWYVNCNPYSSWEDIAGSLYHHHQVAAVEKVRSYLPPRDLTITTEKLMELFAPLDAEKVDELGGEGCLGLPQSEVARIQKDYQSPTQRKEAYLDLYVHQHPCPTWRQVAWVLRYMVNLHQQADFVENTYVKSTQDTLLQ